MTHVIRTTALLALAGAGIFIGFPYYEFFKSKCLVPKTSEYTSIESKCLSKLESLAEEAFHPTNNSSDAVQSSNKILHCRGYISCKGKNLYLYDDGTLTNALIPDVDNKNAYINSN